jgi:hypothetical protein
VSHLAASGDRGSSSLQSRPRPGSWATVPAPLEAWMGLFQEEFYWVGGMALSGATGQGMWLRV